MEAHLLQPSKASLEVLRVAEQLATAVCARRAECVRNLMWIQDLLRRLSRILSRVYKAARLFCCTAQSDRASNSIAMSAVSKKLKQPRRAIVACRIRTTDHGRWQPRGIYSPKLHVSRPSLPRQERRRRCLGDTRVVVLDGHREPKRMGEVDGARAKAKRGKHGGSKWTKWETAVSGKSQEGFENVASGLLTQASWRLSERTSDWLAWRTLPGPRG